MIIKPSEFTERIKAQMSPEVREKYDKVSEAAKIRAAETEEKKQAFIRNISSFAISKFCEAEAMEK